MMQNVLVALIILAAALAAGVMLWRKVRSFAPKKSSCGTDCGCGGKSDPEF